jgi:hypothetical protein
MPVSRLLVEGKLDIEIFGSLFGGIPTVDPDPTSKGSLAPRVRDYRRRRQTACYLRDRDFDFLPSTDLSQPTIDQTTAGAVLGWRSCRHEIENYLIDPAIVNAALGWDRATYEAELVNAAKSIRHYQAARWTVGQARQTLPPNHEFPTKPAECKKDFWIPSDLTETGTSSWVYTQARDFLDNVNKALDPTALHSQLAYHSAILTDAFLADVGNLLVWCSGKDLLGALEPWLQTNHKLHPSVLRNRVRDWITVNPDDACVLLPEWEALRNLIRSYP